jgi:DGQHR domain-containing protein
MSDKKMLILPALEITQGPNRRIYSFAVDGKRLPEFATVSRIKRTEGNELLGYQRPEVVSHISEIRQYIESDSPIVPNSIVVAFDERVKFVPNGQSCEGASQPGYLHIPLCGDRDGGGKPAWIVDGQQRSAAIRMANVKSFPVSVVGFVTGSDEEQREQFILVNSTKPLPKGLIYELLPATAARLPAQLSKRRFPSRLLQRLNSDAASPFRGLIQTPTCPGGFIKDNSLLRAIENSLSDGALYRYQGTGVGGEADEDSMLRILANFWTAVASVFPEAWAKPPRKSRLMHGAGIVSMSFLMDAIADRRKATGIPSVEQFTADIGLVAASCSWTAGYWSFGPHSQIRWSELQNTGKHIQLLTSHLIAAYRTQSWASS